MSGSAPLRFLMLAVGGWACARAAVLAPVWWAEPIPVEAAAPAPVHARAPAVPRPLPVPWTSARPARRAAAADMGPAEATRAAAADADADEEIHEGARNAESAVLPPVQSAAGPVELAALGFTLPPHRPLLSEAGPQPLFSQAARTVPTGRWSFSSWAFLRGGDAPSLATGGMLGGSQVGGRLTYRVNGSAERPLALSARSYAPATRKAAAEVALGLDWKPAAKIPVHILAERRQALGREGRSDVQLTAYGGLSDARLGALRIDAYGQAGIVGAGERDLFADGSVRLSLPLGKEGRLKLGAGAWAAAQPGAARIDVGPQASLSIPVAGKSVTLEVDWRLRAAGDARPGSGPALTLSTGF